MLTVVLVPNIFVNGRNTGGCDGTLSFSRHFVLLRYIDTMALHSKGQLVPGLKGAGLSPAL